MAGAAISVATSGMDDPDWLVREGPLKNATLIAGPTASGKSALALEEARRTGAVVVNADSMQVYGVLNVLTARPGPDELARAPHRLYGHVSPTVAYSTGAWLEDVRRLVGMEELRDRPLVFVGGTGLYFRALLEGLSAMPQIPPQIRDSWRRRLAAEGAPALHAELARLDPAAAARLRPSDGQRVARALEVRQASGRSILEWQSNRGRPLVDGANARLLVIEPERAALVARIERRFDAMVAAGALDEVRAMQALDLDPDLPAAKAIGVRELQAALEGTMALGEAITRAKVATRQYARRQSTWFRNQFGADWRRIAAPGETRVNLP